MVRPYGGSVDLPHELPIVDSDMKCPPGNFYEGRGRFVIRKYILHNTESKREEESSDCPTLSFFMDIDSGVSIHHLISRRGIRYDLVERLDTAFHCGVAKLGGIGGNVVLPAQGVHFPRPVKMGMWNVISEGTEIESSARVGNVGNGYTDEQYWTASYTQACAMISWGLGIVDCLYHRNIAWPSGRKYDPSHFDERLYRDRIDLWLASLSQVVEAETPIYFL